MFYKLRDHIPRDYAAMHEGQNVYNDQGEFHDSFQYQPPPAPVLPSTFPGTQMNSSAPKEDVAALINRRINCMCQSQEWSSWMGDRSSSPKGQINHPTATEHTTAKTETASFKP